jgi:hypothetical protein
LCCYCYFTQPSRHAFFDPNSYQISYPFFEPNGESFLTLLGRDDVVNDINNVVLPDPNNRRVKSQKYMPIIISTSRGMGKTFLLKMIGMQKLKAELKNVMIVEAGSCGRILSFDFAKDSTAIQSVADTKTFLTRLMIYYLCLIFNGTQVDGIYFEEIKLFGNVNSFIGRQNQFNLWKKDWIESSADRMIDEYIRLTNIAFAVDERTECFKTPPVFLLDEIQSICIETNVVSTRNVDGVKMHTWLSLLLTQLAGKHRPICICTGTNNGNIFSITEMSAIIPEILSLTPLVNDYMEYWTEMTNYYNGNRKTSVQLDGDEELIHCLVYASYQIPRLLFIAHQIWFKIRQTSTTNREYFLQNFEEEAIKYYKEMRTVFTNFTVCEIAHIILSCSVHWSVNDLNSCVPGTSIKWSALIQKALIFPYLENCYLFPFTLVWRENPSVPTIEGEKLKAIKCNVEKYCEQKVKNLKIRELFLSFDEICQADLFHFGIMYESLFVSSLAVKYYLWKILQPETVSLVSFSSLYDFGGAESEGSRKQLAQFQLDFSEGICYPENEAFTNQNLPKAVIHNRFTHNAHHDIILPTQQGGIPVSAKASFDYDTKKMNEQLLLSNTSNMKVAQLIWLYLGNVKKAEIHDNVAFLDGSGVCNGLSIDLFVLVKRLKSQNNNNN